jgi:hypothetical protein
VQNKKIKSLGICLSTLKEIFSTWFQNIYSLIISCLVTLSTFQQYGAKIISLYLFWEGKCGKCVCLKLKKLLISPIGDAESHVGWISTRL